LGSRRISLFANPFVDSSVIAFGRELQAVLDMRLLLERNTQLGIGLKLQDLLSDLCGNASFLLGAHYSGGHRKGSSLLFMPPILENTLLLV